MKKLYLITLMFIFSACSPTVQTPSVADIQTAIAETELAAPTFTSTTEPATATTIPEATEIIIPNPTAPPHEPIFGRINVDYLNLRAGPGTFFDILDTLKKNTELQIIGRIKDSFWTNVSFPQGENEPNIVGWMSGELLDIELSLVPIIDYHSEHFINGQINLVSGEAIDNVNVTLTHRINDIETRHFATSNSDGVFLAFYPEEMIGLFDVQITGIYCISSIMNDDCELTDYYKIDSRFFITIPQVEDIQFLYEASTSKLEGRVVNRFGNPVSEMYVSAERDDSAVSSGRTDSDGNFSIPVGEGIWEVYALIINPRNEGDRISVTISNKIHEPIELISPE